MTAMLSDVELIDVSTLRTHPANPRRGDVDKIAESITRHGFAGVLVVQRSTQYIVVGNHRYLAACQLGYERLPCHVLDIDDDAARRLLLADNRASDLATYDEASLVELLDELHVTDDGLTGTLFTEDDLDALVHERDRDRDIDELQPPRGYTFDVFDEQTIAAAAFDYYRRVGFPSLYVPLHVSMLAINALRNTPTSLLTHSRVGYSTADHYHPHRFDCSGRGAPSPRASFDDDNRLRAAIALMLKDSIAFTERSFAHCIGLARGAQTASNFRPAFALALMRKYAPDDATVLDSSTGFGGRLIGFMASTCSTYIGIDPSTLTYEGNVALAAELTPPGKNVELHCLPAEDVPHDLVRERCDVAITSPPYFTREHYSDEDTQSSARYPTPDAWREGFLRPMLALQYAALKHGSVNVINIAAVHEKSSSKSALLPLPDWTIEDAQQIGFTLDHVEHYRLAKMPGAGLDARDVDEPCIVLRKE